MVKKKKQKKKFIFITLIFFTVKWKSPHIF